MSGSVVSGRAEIVLSQSTRKPSVNHTLRCGQAETNSNYHVSRDIDEMNQEQLRVLWRYVAELAATSAMPGTTGAGTTPSGRNRLIALPPTHIPRSYEPVSVSAIE